MFLNDVAHLGLLNSETTPHLQRSLVGFPPFLIVFFEGLRCAPRSQLPTCSMLSPSVMASNLWPDRWDLRLRVVTTVALVVLARCGYLKQWIASG